MAKNFKPSATPLFKKGIFNMESYIASIEGQDYEFDVQAVDEQDARSTAIEYLDLIGMPEWKDFLIIKVKE